MPCAFWGRFSILYFAPQYCCSANATTTMTDPNPTALMRDFLRDVGGCAVLDGGLATELEANGADLNDPLWSAKCLVNSPHLIRTCNYVTSYQDTIQGFETKGFSTEESENLLRKSVEIVLEARDIFHQTGVSSKQHTVLVTTSIGSYGAYLADGSEYRAKSNPPKARKRVEAETLKRARVEAETLKRSSSAFTRCEACNKDVPVVLIDMHSCSLDSKIRQNLESQVVEKLVEAKKPEKKRTSPSSQKKEGSGKKAKKSNDSSKRKRPQTASFVFMEDFRKEFKEANPDNKMVSLVAKEGGERWKSLTEEEKNHILRRQLS